MGYGPRDAGTPDDRSERVYLVGMPDRDASPSLPFEIRHSPIQGFGAFATRRIPAGVRLIEYTGERLTPEMAEGRYPDRHGERHHTFLFAIDDDVVVDASVGGNDARFINHSCDPNCDAVIEDKRIWIETIREVQPRQELVYDYAYVLPERHTPSAKRRYPCSCGAATCRGSILKPKRAAGPTRPSA
ncbi:MAG: hypothetical protein MNPFHGCM_00650 [Gemmatimonadaceae bacterium]|nr:hypothetical protein [Gemmatimonadaceae bacterium]